MRPAGFKISEEHKKKIGLANSIVLKGRHCSPRTEFKKGYTMSEEHKRKISLALKGMARPELRGRTYSPEVIAKRVLGRKGYRHSEETKKKIGDANRGEKSYYWKGGVTPIRKKLYFSQEYKNWRKAVFERDNYTCVFCNEKGGILNADHIKPFALFPKLRFDLNNGRTLCLECHKKTDTYGGKSRQKKEAG